MSSNAAVRFVASSEIREKLLSRLVNGPCTPSQLAGFEGKHVSHVSRALTELRMRGLVEPIMTDSRERFYRATDQGLAIYLALSRFAK